MKARLFSLLFSGFLLAMTVACDESPGTNYGAAGRAIGGEFCTGQCNDGNPCTEDICDPNTGACSWVPVDDGVACHGSGQCVGGECNFPTCDPSWCNDGNPCTEAYCEGGALGACAYNVLADGTPCPGGGVCVEGSCQWGTETDLCTGQCNDGNPCTGDICDPDTGECSWVPVDDGVACHGSGQCVGGECNFPTCDPSWCNDGNPCTHNFCDGGAFGECASEPINEGLSCYGAGFCVEGECRFDTGPNQGDAICAHCDDGNPCTIGICSRDGTCTFNPGNEGIRCGDGRACHDGVCASATCILEECEDDNPCTLASCEGGVCSQVLLPDGQACFRAGGAGDRGGVCANGACVAATCSERACGVFEDPCLTVSCPDGPLGACGPPVPANDGVRCGSGGAVCVGGECVNETCEPALCDDFNPCTYAICDANNECQQLPQPDDTPCGDGGHCLDGEGECSVAVYGHGGSDNYDLSAEETCNGRDDSGNGKIDDGGVCPYPVYQFAGPETMTSDGRFTGGHAYMFITSSTDPQLNWFEAKALCAQYGYHLLTINSQAEADFVHERINTGTDGFGYITADTWIGARLAPGATEWAWQDDVTPWLYEDFSGFVKNPYDAYNYGNYGACAYFGDHERTHWDVSPCSYHRSVVCKSGPAAPADTVPIPPTDYIRGECYYDYDGNEDFGAGFSVCGFIMMNEGAQPGDLPSYLRALGEARGFARLFGNDVTILGVTANAEATSTTAFVEANLTVLGADVFSRRMAAELEIDPLFELEVTFFEASKTFVIGVVPVTASVSLDGALGIKLFASAGIAGINVTPTPYSAVSASGAVGVGVDGVSAGIEITLKLLGIDIPIAIDLILPTFHRLDWAISIDLEVSTLDGSVALYIEVGPLKFTYTLFEWDGFLWSYELYHEDGSIPF